jgi:TPR repeat protein
MSKRGYQLFQEQKYDEAFRRFTIYLKNAKKKNGDGYYKTHKIIDTILEKHQLSKDTLKWLSKYKTDDQEVQIILSKVHYFGSGIKRCYEKTIELLKKTSNHYGLYLLGNMYSNGSGVKKDDIKAVEYFKKSALLGNKFAQYTMGNIYRMEKDYDKAIKYYTDSGNQGNSDAYYSLGQMAELNQGIQSAMTYYNQSHKLGNKKATDKLISIYENCPGNNMQLAKNYEQILSLKYSIRHAKKAGEIYLDLMLTQPLYQSSALQIYNKLVDDGDVESIYNLAKVYRLRSQLNTPNYTTMIKLLERGAETGNSMAQFELGFNYYHGRHYKQNYHKARELFTISLTQDNSDAMYYLGHMYVHGQGGDKNVKLGVLLTEKSSNRGGFIYDKWFNCMENATNNLIGFYQKGDIVPKDLHKALKLSVYNEIRVKKLLTEEKDLLREVIRGVYWMKRLNTIDIGILSGEYKMIKNYIEEDSAIDINTLDAIPFVKEYIKYIIMGRAEMCKNLDKTNLYMPVLHDIVSAYI